MFFVKKRITDSSEDTPKSDHTGNHPTLLHKNRPYYIKFAIFISSMRSLSFRDDIATRNEVVPILYRVDLQSGKVTGF